jgi:hypothetical protein
MAKRVKGHRANKPNDSFGTVNSDTLYRGNYRDEVYQDEDDNESDETMEAQDADPKEATPQETTSFVEQKQEPDHDYKKRYDDLKKHYDTKVNEFKQEIADLKTAMQQAPQAQMPEGVAMPKTPEELQAFKDQYPEVFEIVQTVSSLQAESQLSELRNELGTIKEREKQLEKQKAYEELLRLHPDFDDLKGDDKFLEWLGEQPESISDGIYKNNTDARWAARVLDLYKADTGQTKKRTKSKNSAADAVTRSPAREVRTTNANEKIWKASEIGKMKPWQFEQMEAELDAARAEGRIDYNN